MPHLGEIPEEVETKECANDSAAGNEGVRSDSANDNTEFFAGIAANSRLLPEIGVFSRDKCSQKNAK